MIDKIEKFKAILNEFNAVHSLTNYKNLDEVIKDSLDGLNYIKSTPKVAIDVGSGAGIPALFLAMKFTSCKWHLFEPNGKKSSFLTYAKVALNLDNVIVHSNKIEKSDKFRADLITSRALMKTKDLLLICKGFYDKDTEFLLYKGSEVANEIEDIDAKIYSRGKRNYLVFRGV